MPSPLVSIVMGSKSDLETMAAAEAVLQEFRVPYELDIVSAHRTPAKLVDFATNAQAKGVQVIIAGAGGAAHLPGMVASMTTLPVIGVPVESKALKGMDSLLSIVQMPAGIPVATVAIGNARNAGLLAIQILALRDPDLASRLAQFRADQTAAVESDSRQLRRSQPSGI